MADFLERARLSLCESLREETRRSPGGVVVDDDGLLLFRHQDPFPIGYFNGVVRTDPDLAPTRVIDRAKDFFDDRGFTLWVEGEAGEVDAAALAGGLIPVGGDRAALRYDLEPAAERLGHPDRRDVRHGTWAPPDHVGADDPIVALAPLVSAGEVTVGSRTHLRLVRSDDDAAQFVQVAARAYEQYGTAASAIRSSLGRASSLTAPHIAAVVADVGGKPAATALVYVAYGVACVTWVASDPSCFAASSATARANRSHTVAGLTTMAACVLGYTMGASAVAGPATSLGERLYRRLGGEVFTHYRWYARTP